MNPELIVVPESALFEYLANLERPVMELDIMKRFFNGASPPEERHTLFVKHFSLYHALYKLKFSAGRKGYYLHLDCMRIRLLPVPGKGLCGYYDAELGEFCGAAAPADYCEIHEAECADSRRSLAFDCLQEFYSDEGNITFGDSEVLHKLMNGIKVYAFRKKDIDSALEFFGIHAPGKKIITRRYRELAVKYHPDRCGGSDEMMKRLNSSYMLLKDVFVL